MVKHNRNRFGARTAVIAVCWLLAWAPTAMGQGPDDPNSAASQALDKPERAPPTSPTGESPTADGASSLLGNLDLVGLWQDNTWLRWPFSWPVLLLAILLGWAAGQIAAAVLRRVVARLQTRDRPIRTLVFRHLIGPAKLALLALGLTVGLAQLKMSGPLQTFSTRTLLLLYSFAAFWYVFNLVSVVELLLQRITAKTESALDDQLVPLIRKTLRVVLVVMAAIFVVDSVFKRDVVALVAALGVLGLPLGFAAKDILGNMFGAVIILFNRPFRIGERIVYAGYDGTIEEIGFLSIRVRTLTGNLVTIPNSKIASEAVENVGRRKSIRRTMNVTITYDTPREKIEQAVHILRDILKEDGIREPIHAMIDGNEFPPRVFFNDYNPDSLNLFLIYWYAPPVWWDYVEHAQRLNLRIFEEFEKAGIEFAFPTQTLYLAGDPKRELALKMLGKDL